LAVMLESAFIPRFLFERSDAIHGLVPSSQDVFSMFPLHISRPYARGAGLSGVVLVDRASERVSRRQKGRETKQGGDEGFVLVSRGQVDLQSFRGWRTQDTSK
jgi:hypothetical protein